MFSKPLLEAAKAMKQSGANIIKTSVLASPELVIRRASNNLNVGAVIPGRALSCIKHPTLVAANLHQKQPTHQNETEQHQSEQYLGQPRVGPSLRNQKPLCQRLQITAGNGRCLKDVSSPSTRHLSPPHIFSHLLYRLLPYPNHAHTRRPYELMIGFRYCTSSSRLLLLKMM